MADVKFHSQQRWTDNYKTLLSSFVKSEDKTEAVPLNREVNAEQTRDIAGIFSSKVLRCVKDKLR